MIEAQTRYPVRQVRSMTSGQITSDGAGVRLRRLIATRDLDMVDPFLLLDEFGSSDPDEYIAGFPWHPHRGIETVTYMLEGRVEHADSVGNKGIIGPGDVQWMTSGSGIIHSEMPARTGGRLRGFQLWVNLPARLKMTEPRYQEVSASRIPVVRRPGGIEARVICGAFDGVIGPVAGVAADPLYLDVGLSPGGLFHHAVKREHAAFAYVFEGAGEFGAFREPVTAPCLVVLGEGTHVDVFASREGVRFLLAAGAPLEEPVARGGPFVMNTREEIMLAVEEYRNGTFVK